jgi:hypothetical protein
MRKICPICGKSHEAQRNSKVYCSNSCRKQAFLQKSEDGESSTVGSVLHKEGERQTAYSINTPNPRIKPECDGMALTEELKLYIRGVIEETACIVGENVVGILISNDPNWNGKNGNANENNRNGSNNASRNGNEKNDNRNVTGTNKESREIDESQHYSGSQESQLNEQEGVEQQNENDKNAARDGNGKHGKVNQNENDSSNDNRNDIVKVEISKGSLCSRLEDGQREEEGGDEQRNKNANDSADENGNNRNGNDNEYKNDKREDSKNENSKNENSKNENSKNENSKNENSKNENSKNGNDSFIQNHKEASQQPPYDEQYSPFIIRIGKLESEGEYHDLFCSPQYHLPEEAQKPFKDVSPYVLCAIEETLRLANGGKVVSRQIYFLERAYLYILKRRDFKLIQAIYPATDLMVRIFQRLSRLLREKKQGKIRLVLSRDVKAELIALRFAMVRKVKKHQFYHLFNKPLVGIEEKESTTNQ